MGALEIVQAAVAKEMDAAIEQAQVPIHEQLWSLHERIEALESLMTQKPASTLDAAALPAPSPSRDDQEGGEALTEAQRRLDAILKLHRLEAMPAQWVMSGGKREQAPEGLWEVSCVVCKEAVMWKEGQPNPSPCKTAVIAKGEARL